MIRVISFLVFVISFATSCYGQKKEIDAVKTAFENYKSTILNDKGEEAVKYVDSRTIKYYSDILEKVKTADSSTVAILSVLDKAMVFLIRHRSTREEILSFDGKGLLIYAIKKGMVGKSSVANTSIGDVTIDGKFAKGQFVANEKKAPFDFHFYKEDKEWKIDLTSIFSISTMAIKRWIEESGQTENEYLFTMLEMSNGIKPGQEIWKPVDK